MVADHGANARRRGRRSVFGARDTALASSSPVRRGRAPRIQRTASRLPGRRRHEWHTSVAPPVLFFMLTSELISRHADGEDCGQRQARSGASSGEDYEPWSKPSYHRLPLSESARPEPFIERVLADRAPNRWRLSGRGGRLARCVTVARRDLRAAPREPHAAPCTTGGGGDGAARRGAGDRSGAGRR
jgi:hypothetical protein